ncbi:hypothetical protein G7Y89_g15497 [Cudoniella acicularis]|uniref:Major facilitator superfamily (MFS) profile domain-containing protein n=1 Tax=Cudoniella acicularis TaxID=354080 RepID=A0A8H4VJP6_9HELO|nr:hypothetical protein G7Y89_g15497 [Cudoniella acicularis]
MVSKNRLSMIQLPIQLREMQDGSFSVLDSGPNSTTSVNIISKPPLDGVNLDSETDSSLNLISKPPPDGGITAWTQVCVAYLLVFNGFGYVSSFGIFQEYYTETLGRTASDVSWVGSVQLFLLFFVGTFSGRAMDAGFFRSLIISGCLMQLIGVFATSFATVYWQFFLAQGILQGIGNGFLFTPLVALVSSYFSPPKRTFPLGLASCGAPTGGVVFPLIARQLLPQIGLGWTTRVMGFVILFNVTLIFIFMRPRVVNRVKGPLIEWRAFKEPAYSLFAIGVFFALWGLYFAYYYVAVYGKSVLHVSSDSSLILLMVMNSVGVAGRLGPALLSDKYFGPYNTLIPSVFSVGVILFCWIRVESFDGMLAWGVFYGFWANSVQTLFPSALSSLTVDPTKLGVRVGMVFTIISIACLTGPPIAGALIQANQGSFLSAQLFGGATVLLGTAILVLGRIAKFTAGPV